MESVSGMRNLALASVLSFVVWRAWSRSRRSRPSSSPEFMTTPEQAAGDEARRFEVIPVDPHVVNDVLAQAEFEFLPEDQQWFGTIPGFDGLWSMGRTREASHHDLESALREWISFSVHHGLPLPSPRGINLTAAVSQ